MRFFLAIILLLSLSPINSYAEELPAKSAPKISSNDKDKAAAPISKAAEDPDKSGVQVDDIYVACKYYFSKLFNTRENVSRKNICNGYFFGSASMLLLLQAEGVKTNTCVPMDVSTEEIIKGFLEWTDKNPDKMQMLASEALLEIIRKNYPCMEYKPAPKKKAEPKY